MREGAEKRGMGTFITRRAGAFVQVEKSAARLERVLAFLPSGLCEKVRAAAVGVRIEEIRLRADKGVCLTVGGGAGTQNVLLPYICTAGELARVLESILGGSLYAYSESITRGYISVGDGIRVGVVGHASVEGGRILGIYNITSLNIRLPCGGITLDSTVAKRIIECVGKGEGVLIYSPPGGGKTTALRALIDELSAGAGLRISVIDTREELSIGERGRGAPDILLGYPAAEGIRIATSFMNPQLIICDEIGDEEADEVIAAQNRGVPLIATAHGSTICGLLRRRGMRALHAACAFGLYVGIKKDGHNGFGYDIQTWEDVENEIVRCSIASV